MHPGLLQRDENDRIGLRWVADFRWLRGRELGRLMWPNDKTSRVRANRVIRGWIERRLVIVRQMPDGAGRAVVLSSAGAALVSDWYAMAAAKDLEARTASVGGASLSL
jgi:hypothetical protein